MVVTIDSINDAINEAGPELEQILLILGNHFEVCESCKKEYFENMYKIQMKVISHIKEIDKRDEK